MDERLLTAGYCGLACKACSVYIASCIGGQTLAQRAQRAGMTPEEMNCKGCRSDKTSPYCTSCEIKKCIRSKGLTWCSECDAYPCQQLKDFQASRPHRAEILNSLDFAQSHSLEQWEEAMHKDFACERCGTFNSVYSKGCLSCGYPDANSFAQRYQAEVNDSHERHLAHPLIISKLETARLKEALALVWKVFLEFEAPDYSDEGIQEFERFINHDAIEQMLSEGQYQMWTASYNDQIVGVLAVRPACHISLLFVARHYQRKGIAKAVLGEIIKHYKDYGACNEITVNASPYAVEAYHRLGFADTGTEQCVNGIRFTPMKCPL